MYLESRLFYLFLSITSLSVILFIFFVGSRQSFSHLEQQTLLSGSHLRQSFAYATFLSPPTSRYILENTTDHRVLDDPYFVSVRLLNYQIKYAEKTKTRLGNVPFLVLVLPTVPKIWIERLHIEGATLVPIETLEIPDAFDKDFITHSRFRDVLSKLRLWQLTDYDKILYLDADSFLLQNLDGIFTDPDLSTTMSTLPSNATRNNDKTISSANSPETYLMAASSDTYGDQTEWEDPGHVNYLCACFMLLSPSQALFSHYIHTLHSPEAPQNAAYPEQDLLIYVHRKHGPMPWRRIPIWWSANDGEMNDELSWNGGVKSLHIKGWEGAEGGNVAGDRYKQIWRDLVSDMQGYWAMRLKERFRE